jgi:hypothetical protein
MHAMISTVRTYNHIGYLFDLSPELKHLAPELLWPMEQSLTGTRVLKARQLAAKLITRKRRSQVAESF